MKSPATGSGPAEATARNGGRMSLAAFAAGKGFVLAGFLLAGCISGEGMPARAMHPAARVGGFLAGAEDEDEVVELLAEPKPEPAPPEKPPEPGPPMRPSRFGVRCGLLITVAADEGSWNPTVCAGVYYRGAQLASKHMVYELGFDYVPVEREDGTALSSLYFLRGELLFGNWSTQDRKTSAYFLGGADVISEAGALERTGELQSFLAFGINLGAGIGSTKGTWDLRAVYALFPGSGNVKGNVLVATGFSF